MIVLLLLPAVVQAQSYTNSYGIWTYTTTDDTITLTAYNGTNPVVVIPSTIEGLPVVNIGPYAFWSCPNVTSVTIGSGVTNIEDLAFFGCTSLTNVTIGDGVTSIGEGAFIGCSSLTSVTIPGSVTSIGDFAFSGCTSLTSVYFQGNAPTADSSVFKGDSGSLTVYYLPGTTGWAEFATNTGISTAFWTLPYPLVLQGSVGVQSNQFSFIVSWATNLSVVVEASTDLTGKNWTPIQTNALNNGVVNFSDPQWTNFPGRYYRLRSP